MTTSEQVDYMYHYVKDKTDVPRNYLDSLHKLCLAHPYMCLPDQPYTAFGELRRIYLRHYNQRMVYYET